VIGDVHGCLGTLEALVKKLGADPDRDHFCFVGDIVNRGPESLNSLRWIMNLGDRAYVTLGNHDLHLLATLHDIRRPGRRDTLDEILAAPDRDQIIDWLRTRPVLHDNIAGFVMVHAGIHPHWSLDQARAMARELEHALAADDYLHFLAAPPCEAPSHLLPWYAVPGRRKWDKPVVFGHWSAHPAMAPPGIIPAPVCRAFATKTESAARARDCRLALPICDAQRNL